MKNSIFFTITFLITGVYSFAQVKDNEGNTYPTEKIFGNIWMLENLNTSKFNNGDKILEVKNLSDWQNAVSKKIPAFYVDPNNPQLGKIYNGYAVTDKRGIAPLGMIIPNSGAFDWFTLNSSYITLPKNISKDIFLGKFLSSKGFDKDCFSSKSYYVAPKRSYTDYEDTTIKWVEPSLNYMEGHGIWWSINYDQNSEKYFCGSRCTGMDGEVFLGYEDLFTKDSTNWLGWGFYVRCVKPNSIYPAFSNLTEAYRYKTEPINFILHNEAFKLSDSIFNLKKIQRLQLLSCNIEILPDKFDSFTELTYLDLSGNEIKSLPSSIGKLKKLEYLNLEYCFALKVDFNILKQLINCKYMKIPCDYQNKAHFEEQVAELKKILKNCVIEY